MEFEWDPNKNEANLRKHGIDFEDAAQVLRRDHYLQRSDRGAERRWMAVGKAKGHIWAVIYTKREGRFRIISARRARENEREDYRKEIS